MNEPYDILIMGAGPAGSAAGNFLAHAGLRVLIVEGEKHPRHHIGESLLPGSVPILNALGISSDTLTATCQPKFGARFYDPAGDRLVTFGFEPTPGSPSPAYQVSRETFDALLAQKARDAGCDLWENAVIETFDEQADRPSVTLRDGRTVSARFLVDATGRDALIATKHREKRLMADYGRVGIYTYFADLPAHDEHDARYITMYLFPAGWVWLIPLSDGRTSVGIVFRDIPEISAAAQGQTKQEALFWHAANTMPRLTQRLRGARITDSYRAISDYSYTVDHKFGPRWAAVGDAAGFLDPLFSSGVHLALASAQRASAAILDTLHSASTEKLQAYAAHMDAGFHVFRAFVHRFYHRDLANNLFFAPNKPPGIHLAITRILAGHVWDPTNPVLKMLGVS